MRALSPRAGIVLLALLLAAATVVALALQPSEEEIEDAFGAGGVAGPILYAVAYALLTLAFVPGAPLTLAAGALYGVGAGMAVVMAGASAGAIGAFAIARRSVRGTVVRASGSRIAAIERRLRGRGFYALLVLRLIPVVPFNALNYAAGASPVGTRDYALATVVGIAPGALVYTALGAGIDDPISPLFIGAAAGAIALAVAARAYSRRLDARSAGVADRADGQAGATRDEAGSAEMRRLWWSLALFAVAVAALAAAAGIGLFH